MKTMIEVFYLRIIGDTVCYQRKQVDLSKKSEDPNLLIQSLIQKKLQASVREVKERCMIHSTSWRYTSPDQVILTYIVYSDEFKFGKGTVKNLTLKKLRTINIAKGQPRSRAGLENQVVAHAMRHISFLIKTDYRRIFKNAFTPKTRKIFKSLWVSLAGQIDF